MYHVAMSNLQLVLNKDKLMTFLLDTVIPMLCLVAIKWQHVVLALQVHVSFGNMRHAWKVPSAPFTVNNCCSGTCLTLNDRDRRCSAAGICSTLSSF